MPKFKFNFNHGTRYVKGPLVNLGTTRGKGSSTRILYHCKSNSENPSDCINQFVSAAPPPSISNNSLFNTSTFNLLFDIYGSGSKPIIKPPGPEYKPLPALLIEALNVAANRWGKFLEFSLEMKGLIRTFSNQIGYTGSLSQWNGLALINCEIKDYLDKDDTLAECTPYYIDGLQTSMNYGFLLKVKKSLFNNGSLTISQNYLNNIITHELGHALGMPVNISSINGNGEQLLPNMFVGVLSNYETNPPAYGLPYFPRAVATFNQMNGWVDKAGIIPQQNNYIPLTNEYENPGAHLRPNTIYMLQGGSIIDRDVFYRGFYNEIMIPYIEEGKPLYISQLSIDILRDIYTSWNDDIIYNYSYKGGNETSETDYQSETELIVFS
jgi:hypothetical protein